MNDAIGIIGLLLGRGRVYLTLDKAIEYMEMFRDSNETEETGESLVIFDLTTKRDVLMCAEQEGIELTDDQAEMVITSINSMLNDGGSGYNIKLMNMLKEVIVQVVEEWGDFKEFKEKCEADHNFFFIALEKALEKELKGGEK